METFYYVHVVLDGTFASSAKAELADDARISRAQIAGGTFKLFRIALANRRFVVGLNRGRTGIDVISGLCQWIADTRSAPH